MEIAQDDEMMLSQVESKVYSIVELFNRPVTVEEIAYEMGMDDAIIARLFDSLVKKDKLVIYSPSTGKIDYYAPYNSKSGLDAVLSQKYADLIGPLQEKYNQAETEQKRLKDQLNSLYANIITMMGVFVAIFALIIVNINGIGLIIQPESSIKDAIIKLLMLNIPLLISIIVLILGIKWLTSTSKFKKKGDKRTRAGKNT